jgi:8-oxo-dGTP pyrophosphatase MutT (NUDIX family)
MRPKDAASLILVRHADRGPEILMGRRAPRHAFMPDVFVFPGGGVSRSDGYVHSAGELTEDVLTILSRDRTPHRARAIALAAIRETYEETGLMLARTDTRNRRSMPKEWRDFAAAGLAPALDGLRFLARAITPPGPPRRFYARFFLADAEDVTGTLRSNGELLDLDWFPLEDTINLAAPNVTKLVLREVMAIESQTRAKQRKAKNAPLILRKNDKRIISFE